MNRFSKIVTTLIAICSVTLSGCGEAKNTDMPKGELKRGENGMKYVLTCMEGHTFIATQSSYEYWNLSGPIGECSK